MSPSMRCQRITLSLLSLLYNLGLSFLVFIVMSKKTSCYIPPIGISIIIISRIFWIITDFYILFTIHPENVTGLDASRIRYLKYQRDEIFYTSSFIFRIATLIVGFILLIRKDCYQMLGSCLLFESLIYVFIVAMVILIIEPIYGGKMCWARFHTINDEERQTLIQA